MTDQSRSAASGPPEGQPGGAPRPADGAPLPASGRAPLDASRVRSAVPVPGPLWSELTVLAETASTNADAVAAAERGAREGLVVVAEEQTAGRGRLGRSWTAPPGTALTFSVLLRPAGSAPGDDADADTAGVPVERWGWLPLLTGVAMAEAIRAVSGADVGLKWPNDLVVDDGAPTASGYPGRKLGGILAERAGGAVVVGIGVNTDLTADELPVPTATSLALLGHPTDRAALLAEALRRIAAHYTAWTDAAGDAVAAGLTAAYAAHCRTLGRHVRVELPGGRRIEGTATAVAPDGCLLVETVGRGIAVGAGDVVHLR